jgi:hypothetical protein
VRAGGTVLYLWMLALGVTYAEAMVRGATCRTLHHASCSMCRPLHHVGDVEGGSRRCPDEGWHHGCVGEETETAQPKLPLRVLAKVSGLGGVRASITCVLDLQLQSFHASVG